MSIIMRKFVFEVCYQGNADTCLLSCRDARMLKNLVVACVFHVNGFDWADTLQFMFGYALLISL